MNGIIRSIYRHCLCSSCKFSQLIYDQEFHAIFDILGRRRLPSDIDLDKYLISLAVDE